MNEAARRVAAAELIQQQWRTKRAKRATAEKPAGRLLSGASEATVGKTGSMPSPADEKADTTTAGTPAGSLPPGASDTTADTMDGVAAPSGGKADTTTARKPADSVPAVTDRSDEMPPGMTKMQQLAWKKRREKDDEEMPPGMTKMQQIAWKKRREKERQAQ